MYADSIFRICLIVSVSLHLGLILPWPFLNLLSRHDEAFQKIEMTYFSESKIAEVASYDSAPRYQQKLPPSAAAKPIEGNSNSEPVDIGKVTSEDQQKEGIITPKEISAKKEEKNKIEAADISTLKGAIYERYYLDVRDKIKSIIEKNKKGLLKESEIYVRFVVDRDGTLRNIYLYKSSGLDASGLERLAIKSIKEAAPFLPFSDKIKEDELQFNLPIRVIRRY